MKRYLAFMAVSGTLLLGQTPDLTGVWRADLSKSKRTGPPVINYLVIIEQKTAVYDEKTKEEAPLVTETTGTWGQREDRAALSFFTNGKPTVRPYHGVPTRVVATTESGKLVVKGEVAGRPSTFTRTYELSDGGKTLTMDEQASSERGESHSTIVLMKQDEAAAEPLRKPEELAGAHFKNVTTASLKPLPVSEFINQMQYYAWSLGTNCEFCHVQRKFDADDKKHKLIARKMIDMVAAINEHNFENKQVVGCFTCHESHAHPLTRQMYPDEIEAEKARLEKEAAERAAHPPGAGGPPPPPQH